MKITVINQSDGLGGAAVVAYRLTKALQEAGCDSRMLVMKADAHRDDVVEYGNNLRGRSYFLAERLEIFLKNGFSRERLFKVSTASFGFDISGHPLVKDADAIIINWVNQGAMSIAGLQAIAMLHKPTIWIMHDMWCLTGICHHAYDCLRYSASCGKCRFLGSNNDDDLSHKVLLRKRKLYDNAHFKFVAVSNWLAQRCHKSSLLGNADVSVIRNAFPIDEYVYTPDFAVREKYGIPAECKVVIMGAARLDDPVKGFDRAVQILNRFEGKNVHAVFFGNIRDVSKMEQLRIPYTSLGMLDAESVAPVYRIADVVISTSFFETSGATLVEGMASGCVPVAFDSGGQGDIIEHQKDGWLAKANDCEDFAKGLQWAFDSGLSRKELHDSAKMKFDSHTVAQQYIDLLQQIKI